MIDRINFTGRRRITRRHVEIRITTGGDGVPCFDAMLSLGELDLLPAGRVFIEAYRQTAWQRFDFGTVGQIRPPDDRRLDRFGSADGVLFRVKVVQPAEAATDGRPALILALAESIRPRAEAGQTRRQSLLPIVPDDFRDEVWRLSFDESTEPVLRISRHLVPDWRSLAGTPEFVCLVLPEILRSILSRILLVEEHSDPDDTTDWRTRWLRFARRLPGVPPPPHRDEGDAEEWIEQAVEAFCRRGQIAERFRQWRAEKE